MTLDPTILRLISPGSRYRPVLLTWAHCAGSGAQHRFATVHSNATSIRCKRNSDSILASVATSYDFCNSICHDRMSSLPGAILGGDGAIDGDGRQVYIVWSSWKRRAVAAARKKGGNIGRPAARADHYGAAYVNFASELYAQIRAEAFGEDIGQQSWLSAEEHDRVIAWLELRADHRLLDVACGSGGPTLRIAERTGCRVHGLDLEADAIRAAQAMVRERGLTNRAAFAVADASRPLDFAPQSFDGIVCIDAISHFPDRRAVLAEWSRLLKPGGSVVYTDPLVVTGPLSSREIAVRSFDTIVLFVPPGVDERAIASAGLSLVRLEDTTENMARFAARRLAARQARRKALVEIEGKEEADRRRELFTVAAAVAAERRLSRFLFHARKPA